MTDKPRLIDADKLERFLEEEIGGLAAKRIEITIAAGLFDPDPPQHPDIQVRARNWQEDMELSEQAKGWTFEITFNGAGNIVTEDANYTFAQVIAGDVGIGHAEIILDGLEALPYWLQQYAELQREYERFQQVAKGWNDDLTAAESLIQQKDAVTFQLKNMLLDAIGCLTMFGNEKCEEQARRIGRELRKLTQVQPEQASLLQDVGDSP